MARAAPLPRRPHRRPSREGLPPERGRGRGAKSNASGRYEKLSREDDAEAWSGDDAPPPLRTEVTTESPRRIINYVNSPFVGFDRSINPVRGCEHGCIYCFARPTHAYYGLSAGLDFESKLFAKPNAATLLRRELSAKNYKPKHIAIGTNTDPYQPVEKRFRIMRGILKTLHEFRHPVSILTKSALIARDIDILAPMAERRLVSTMLSLTTLDPHLARAMEPRATTPARRLETIRRLSESGLPIGVMTAPMIPGLNDDELETLLETAKEAGATFAGYTIIRLPLEVAPLFREWLEATYPNRAARVLHHIHDMNGGKDYDPQWSRAERPKSVYARLIAARFHKATARLGFDNRLPPLELSRFRVPGSENKQLRLFLDRS